MIDKSPAALTERLKLKISSLLNLSATEFYPFNIFYTLRSIFTKTLNCWRGGIITILEPPEKKF